MKNDEGVSFVASLKPDKGATTIDAVDEVGQVMYNVNTLDAHLKSSCAVMSIDYWNYEWCHRRHVSQFHLEQQGNGFTKTPEWSLGKYSRTEFIRENNADQHNETVPITKVIDYFTNGQHCDENNSPRTTEVHLQCCEGEHIQNYIPTDVYYAQSKRNTGPPMPKATMNILEEPNTCAYKAVVCTPLLCKPNKPIFPTTAIGGSALTNVMLSLNNSCLMRQEDWWTYELCFTKGVRQLRINVEQSVLADGTVEQKKVVVNQYILGNPLLEVYANETALSERVTSHHGTSQQPQREAVSSKEAQIIASSGLVSPLFHTRGKEPKHLELEFTNGTACDIDNVNRSIVVELYCGLTNSILSTWEDSTCHYRMKAELTILCALPDFLPKKDNASTIEIIPLHPVEVDEEEESSSEDDIIVTASTADKATTGTAPSPAPLKTQRAMEALSLQKLKDQEHEAGIKELLDVFLEVTGHGEVVGDEMVWREEAKQVEARKKGDDSEMTSNTADATEQKGEQKTTFIDLASTDAKESARTSVEAVMSTDFASSASADVISMQEFRLDPVTGDVLEVVDLMETGGLKQAQTQERTEDKGERQEGSTTVKVVDSSEDTKKGEK
eukprot:gene23711-29959_t